MIGNKKKHLKGLAKEQKQEMKYLRELYSESVLKWLNVLKMTHQGKTVETLYYAKQKCAFCREVDKDLYGDCNDCLIKHDICYILEDKNDDRGLVGECYKVLEEWSTCQETIDSVYESIRKILVALRKEWRDNKDASK
ncbi:MAG: hypothetical protein R6U96_04615 [Promethearchaeia archaeon]